MAVYLDHGETMGRWQFLFLISYLLLFYSFGLS